MGFLKRLWEKSEDVGFALLFFMATFGIGFIIVLAQKTGRVSTAALWSLACIASGSVIGFLFGIPRVLQQDAAPPANEGEGDAKAAPVYRLQVNTNLEQISDWLTKIIVGVGLIEMRRFPELLNRASTFVGKGLGAVEDTQTMAGGLIIYFSVMGFLCGYLLTRLYLTGAFKRADEQAVLSVGGNELTMKEVTLQMQSSLADLQEQVVKMQEQARSSGGSFSIEAVPQTVERSPKVRTVLWVDDFPKNNSLIIDYLNNLGIEVSTAVTTDEGLSQLRRREFDRLITDMGRVENGEKRDKAGIELIRAVKEDDKVRNPDIPIVVYCSAPAAKRYGEEAIEAGALRVTPSQTELIEALEIYE